MRLTHEDEERILAAYRAWSPTLKTADALCEELGVSKQTLYNLLRRRGVPTKSVERSSGPSPRTSLVEEMVDSLAERALTSLIDENRSLREKVEAGGAEEAGGGAILRALEEILQGQRAILRALEGLKNND